MTSNFMSKLVEINSDAHKNLMVLLGYSSARRLILFIPSVELNYNQLYEKERNAVKPRDDVTRLVNANLCPPTGKRQIIHYRRVGTEWD